MSLKGKHFTIKYFYCKLTKFYPFRMMVFYNKAIVVKIVLAGVSHLFDLIKDSVILVEISRSQRGIIALFGQTKPYIKSVCT